MNKYEKLFSNILTQTQEGTMQWKQLGSDRNENLIMHPNTVWRQYESELRKGNDVFQTILVEKKYPDPQTDFAYDAYYPEVLILDRGMIVATLNDSIIERTSLAQLTNLVEGKSDAAQRLFA